MNALMIEPTSGPVPTFSPSLAQLCVTPALIGLAWQMKFPWPQAPSRIDVDQPRAKLVSCTSTCNGASPTEARVAFTSATNDDSSAGVAPAVAGTKTAKNSIQTVRAPTSLAAGRRADREGDEVEVTAGYITTGASALPTSHLEWGFERTIPRKGIVNIWHHSEVPMTHPSPEANYRW